jgi:biopolymer transport protein TolQ
MHLVFGSFSVFSSAYSQSDLFGKLIFLSLFLLSAICWLVLIQRIYIMRKVRSSSFSFQEAFEKNKAHLLSLGKEHFPLSTSKEVPHPFADIFFTLKEKTLEVLRKNHFFSKQGGKEMDNYLSISDLEQIESHVWTTISGQSKQLDKNLFILSTIVTLAPFLGLLGTVWGILMTFSELQKGAMASSNQMILGGLSTALATTVLGLVIAIPALISYNYLKTSTKKISSDMEDFLYRLLSTLELQYRKSDLP